MDPLGDSVNSCMCVTICMSFRLNSSKQKTKQTEVENMFCPKMSKNRSKIYILKFHQFYTQIVKLYHKNFFYQSGFRILWSSLSLEEFITSEFVPGDSYWEQVASKITTFDSVWATMLSNVQTVDLPVLGQFAGLGQMARLDTVQSERFVKSSGKRKVFSSL